MRTRSQLAVLCVAIVFGEGVKAESNAAERAAWHPLNVARIADVRGQRPTSMREASYRRLSRAHELLGDALLEQAIKELDRLAVRGLNTYEHAQVMQTYGFIYSQQGEQARAFEAFEACIELDALPLEVQQGIVYSLASYYSSEGRYAESNEMLMRWFRFEAEPTPDAYVLAAINHSEQHQIAEALPYAKRANDLTEPAREAWMELELALLVELDRYPEAAALLERMIALWPATVRYYETLSGLYVELGEEKQALSALMVPWLDGLLTEESAVLRLVRLTLYVNDPARGGRILQRAIDAGNVEPTAENLELLLGAWTNAREAEKAVKVVDMLAERASHGRFFLEQALLLNERGEWRQVVEATGKAIDKGNLERPAEAWLLRGIAMTELERFEEALESFDGAYREGDERAKKHAETWSAYVRELAGGR